MNEDNVELYSISPFKEDGRWYLKLIYKYEDGIGKHTVVIPKAAIPFTQWNIPTIKSSIPYSELLLDRPCIDCNDRMLLYDSTCDLATERSNKKSACYFDIITEYAVKEMTLDEIEEKLGYKIKIVNNKKGKNK